MDRNGCPSFAVFKLHELVFAVAPAVVVGKNLECLLIAVTINEPAGAPRHLVDRHEDEDGTDSLEKAAKPLGSVALPGERLWLKHQLSNKA